MKMEAFGEIGLLPTQFYQMRHADYILMQRGFSNGREYDQAVLRKAVEILISPHLTKPVDIRTIWRLSVDDKNVSDTAQRALNTLKRLKENDISYVKVGNKIVEVINKPKEN